MESKSIYEQLAQTTEQLNIIPPLFYYDNKISICLLMDRDGVSVARGIAICSALDQFSKEVGRNLALTRALRAIKKGTSGHINPHRFNEHKSFIPRLKEAETLMSLTQASFKYAFKSTAHPVLTELETKLLGKKELVRV
jgi:hypothetical protein